VTLPAPLVVLPAVALQAGNGIDPPFDSVAAEIITAMGRCPFRLTLVFVTGFDLFPVGVTIGAEGFLVAGGTGLLLLARIKLVSAIEIVRLVVQGPPAILVAFRAIDKTLHLHRVLSLEAGGVCAGEKKDHHEDHQRYGNKQDHGFIFHASPSLP
jgi:hypothetical protein